MSQSATILFVDDNELNRVVLEDMLEILFVDCKVITSQSVEEALELEIDDFDIILSDIDMPKVSGFGFYDILRKEKNYAKPIIAVTALAVSGDREKILMHGFSDYISKPIDMNELEQLIKKYI